MIVKNNKKEKRKSNIELGWLSLENLTSLLMFFALLIVLILPLASAEIGCCFNPSNGLCTMNSESESCTAPGEFYGSPSCSINKCNRGCCILGEDTKYSTSRECQLLSQQHGFEYNWQIMAEEDCYKLSQALEKGACLYGDYAPFDCVYTTYAQCRSGRFYANATCTRLELNTTCKQTNNTFCYNEDVYYKDSCGNPDMLKEDCDYEKGTTCSEKTKTEAYCRNLNCENRKNGESWCLKEDPNKVGSRYFVQYCLNGKIETEPCADFRMEYCEEDKKGNAKCKINPWQECLAANLGGEKDEITGKHYDIEACDSEYCYEFEADRSMSCISGTSSMYNPPIGQPPSGWYPTSGDYCKIGNDWYSVDANGNVHTGNPQASTPVGTSFEISNPLMKQIKLDMCTPKIPGGMEFYGTFSKESSENGGCSAANFVGDIVIVKDEDGNWWCVENCGLTLGVNGDNEITQVRNWNGDVWVQYNVEGWSFNGWAQMIHDDPSTTAGTTGMFVNPEAVSMLDERCRAIGDCDGKANWVGVGGGGGAEIGVNIPREIKYRGETFNSYEYWTQRGEHFTLGGGIKLTLNYECTPFKAPSGDADCEKCGKDGLPCSEYRCRALGKGCEYKEPEGADKGYCVKSSDFAAPKITLKSMNPSSPIPPYTPVEITITTDEQSECKFNLNYAGSKYEDMKYDFGKGFGLEHTIRLTLPGQTAGVDVTKYPLITEDGKYTLFVRCIDVAENGKTSAPFLISFEVMQYPDVTPPFLSNFNPTSGSSIRFNTTEKFIKFELNEPAECRWSLYDKEFERMENNFSCDTTINSDPLDKYECSGTLTNITTNLSEQTRFFIKCKDQPWMINDTIIINNVTYRRNSHDSRNDYEYILRPSAFFEILEVNPSGSIKKSASNTSVLLSAITSGGAANGLATCKWRISNESNFENSTFVKFFNTNSNIHKQLLTSLTEGTYYAQVKCNDSAGNEDNKTTSFTLIVDRESPFITRAYQKGNSLKIFTNEEAICYSSFDKMLHCLYEFINATLMSGVEKEHSIEWQNGKNYYIKCKDYQENINNGCAAIIRTY